MFYLNIDFSLFSPATHAIFTSALDDSNSEITREDEQQT